MVKKLLKHECTYYMHILPIVYAVLLGVALMGRLIRIFENDSVAYGILNGFAITALYLASIAAMTLTLIFCIIRFFKNMFGGEGYLTLTLPVTPSQHLLSKLIGSVGAQFATVLTILTAVCLLLAGDWLIEIVKAILYSLKPTVAEMGVGNLIGYIVEGLLLIPVSVAANYMTYYTCICIGQTLRRGRVIAAIGIYYGLNMIGQTLFTILTILAAVVGESGIMIHVLTWIETHTYGFFHILLCVSLIGSAVWAFLCFLLSRRILLRKLNLV